MDDTEADAERNIESFSFINIASLPVYLEIGDKRKSVIPCTIRAGKLCCFNIAKGSTIKLRVRFDELPEEKLHRVDGWKFECASDKLATILTDCFVERNAMKPLEISMDRRTAARYWKKHRLHRQAIVFFALAVNGKNNSAFKPVASEFARLNRIDGDEEFKNAFRDVSGVIGEPPEHDFGDPWAEKWLEELGIFECDPILAHTFTIYWVTTMQLLTEELRGVKPVN